jgi:hypothetical protein
MSNTSVSGFDGVSMKTSLVFGRSGALKAAGSLEATKLVSMPNFGRMPPNSCWVAPKMPCGGDDVLPRLHQAITVDRIAAMPLAVAMQASAPSSAARRSCSMLTVGLEKRP